MQWFKKISETLPKSIRVLAFYVALLGCVGAHAASSITLAWDPSPETDVTGYRVYYGTTSRGYSSSVDASGTSASVSGLVDGTVYFLAVTARNAAGLESDYSTELVFTNAPSVPGNTPTNVAPTLAQPTDVTLNEGAGQQVITLSGIGSGSPTENQTLVVTATTSNPGLIPNPAVTYTSPNATGTLRFTPMPFAFGSATITVTVNDGQALNGTTVRSFTVTVNSVNQAPTLDAIANRSVTANAGAQTVNLTGITTGATNETQTLSIVAVSSDPSVVPNPTVAYTSPSRTGTLTFSPVSTASGTATITVSVSDGDPQNGSVSRSFVVTVSQANQPPTLNAIASRTINENAGAQTVNLSGIGTGAAGETQTLTVTATSSNPSLIPNPTVAYTSPNATGTLTFTPVAYAYGFSTITVTVSDGQAQNSVVTRTFNVVVNDRPYISAIYDQVTMLGSNLPPVQFTISDTETTASNLVLSATSSLPTLLAETNIVFEGFGGARTMILTPTAGQSGTSMVSVAVSDGSASSSSTFRFVVATNSISGPVSSAPTIAGLTNVVMEKSTSAGPIPFKVWDVETPAGNLVLQVDSSVPTLVPLSGILLGGAGTNRTITVTPAAGQSGETTIAITVSDGGTVTTASFRVTVLAVGQATLNVATSGEGTIIRNFGQTMSVGSTYTVTAVAEPGYVFTGWSGSMNSGSQRLTFTATPNMTLAANFEPVSSNAVTAGFNGLFSEASVVRHANSGFVALNTMENGKYSGYVRIGGERRAFKGSFDGDYLQTTNQVTFKDGRSVTVELSLIKDSSEVVGRVTDGTWESLLTAYRHTAGKQAEGASFAGNYSLVIPSSVASSNGPTGDGYGSVKINSRGVARFAGILADGTKVTQSASLSRNGQWPFQAGLYAGSGSMFSWLTFTNSATNEVNGAVSWHKPAGVKGLYTQGFTTSSDALGSKFTPGTGSLKAGSHLTIAGGSLVDAIEQLISLDAKGRMTQGTNQLSLKVSDTKGTFTGTMIDPTTGAKRKFSGTILQKQGTGHGFMPVGDKSSKVSIKP